MSLLRCETYLTGSSLAQYSHLTSTMMAKWLTALVLIAALGANALAGFSMHPAEQGCGMPGCCETAHGTERTPEVMAARLCCLMNCPQPAPTAPTATLRISPAIIVALHPALVSRPIVVPDAHVRFYMTNVHSSDAYPAYLRHLSLLI